jgi:hypothetical protein
VCVGINADYLLLDNITEVWYLDNITSARPYVVHFYLDDEDPDLEWSVELYPHSVVEVTEDMEVSFYDMLDFDTSGIWLID